MAPDCDLNTTGPAITTAQEFFVTYCITFNFLLLCLVTFRVQLVNNLHKLLYFNIFTSIFVKIFCIWNIITGLYWVARQCGHFQAPVPKFKTDKRELNQKPTQSAPPIDEHTTGIQTRPTLILDDNPPLLTPKEVYQLTKQLKSSADTTSEGETPVSQVMLLLGTTPSKNNQIQHRNMPNDISDILGTKVYQGYIETLVTNIRRHNCKSTQTVPATCRRG